MLLKVLLSPNGLKSAGQTIVEISGISSGRPKVVHRRPDSKPGIIFSNLDDWNNKF